MSDVTKAKDKHLDAADVKAQLGIADTRLPLDVARARAQGEKEREKATETHLSKHENDKGLKFIKHRDYNHLQQPGGAMKGS